MRLTGKWAAFGLAVLPFVVATGATAKPNTANIVLADFEGSGYGAWRATGTAFGQGPAHASLPNQMAVTGYMGTGFVSSFNGGDDATGTLTSPDFTISRRYIQFLIGGGGFPDKTCMTLYVDGKAVRSATGTNTKAGGSERLDWQNWDVSAFQGKKAHIEIIDAATGGWGHINVDQIVMNDSEKTEVIDKTTLYHETYRPQFHFSSATGWLNDPNGMVYYEGEYHLFFQHNPFGTGWGHMTWGHAVSPDMVHWTQLDNALKPDALGTMFSGSAVVDWENTSGLGDGKEPPLVAFYTAAGGTSPESKGQPFTQCLAYSRDKGRTWTKYAENPILKHIAGENRDPKVVWYAPTRHWIMALYLDAQDKSEFGLFSSPDLKKWTHIQTVKLAGSGECPDFFEIPVDGDTQHKKWVLTSADGNYLVGSFDGTKFTSETSPLTADYGNGYYAVQTFSDVPSKDGRRIQIAWMRNGNYPEMPFNQQMSFPCEITLHTTPEGIRMKRLPVKEIEKLYKSERKWHDVALTPGSENPLKDLSGGLYDVQVEFELQDAKEFGIRVGNADIRYNVAEGSLACLGKTAPLVPVNNRITLRILVDKTSLEIFGNGGQSVMTSCFLPRPGDDGLAAYADGGTVKVTALTVHTLSSAWPAKAGGTGKG